MLELIALAGLLIAGLAVASVIGVVFLLFKIVFWAIFLPFRLLFKLIWLPVGLVVAAFAAMAALLALLVPAIPFILLGLMVWAVMRKRPVVVS